MCERESPYQKRLIGRNKIKWQIKEQNSVETGTGFCHLHSKLDLLLSISVQYIDIHTVEYCVIVQNTHGVNSITEMTALKG